MRRNAICRECKNKETLAISFPTCGIATKPTLTCSACKMRDSAIPSLTGIDKQSAIEQLRTEVTELAIQAAGKILQENMDDSRQRKLVDKFIDELPKN